MSTSTHEPRSHAGPGDEPRRAPEGSQHESEVHHRVEREAGALARGLGWLSLGLGLAQITAPGLIARIVGARRDRTGRRAIRAIGAREVAAGLAILTRSRPVGWLFSRVAGDVVDLALLGSSLSSRRSEQRRLAVTTATVLGLTVLDARTGFQLFRRGRPSARRALHRATEEVKRAVTIDRPVEEVYRFFRDLENLPRFMSNLESVRLMDERRSHWAAEGPGGTRAEWDAEITSDRPNELIAWRSLEGSEVENAGSVRFSPAPGGRGTEVHVTMTIAPPAGRLGSAVSKLFGADPGREMIEDLGRLKQLLETGEVARSEASISRGPRPARPPGTLEGGAR